MHGGRQHRRRGSFRGIGLVAHAQLGKYLLGICENVHQMTDRRALIAADIANTSLEKRFGECQNTLAREGFPFTNLEFLHFLGK
jgi:hypothetical protein